jgi:hypothetical protein
MKSPVTGKEMPIIEQWTEVKYKGKEFGFPQKVYFCVDSGETFTTTELDEENLKTLEEEWEHL